MAVLPKLVSGELAAPATALRERSFSSAKGACQSSPGQRPGNETQKNHKALKGRHNLCRNPSPACALSEPFFARI
jgi:hypothetical protein